MKYIAPASLLLGVSILASVQLLQAQEGGPPQLPEVVTLEHQDVSPALRDIPLNPAKPALNKEVTHHIPWDRIGGNRPTVSAPDPLRQTTSATTSTSSATPAATNSFDGLSDDDNAAVTGGRVVPPDTNGDVGPNHYVQMINSIFAVYRKSDHARILGPLPNSALWAGFNGVCGTRNDGDPIVLYDHLADRWVLSQFAIQRDGYQCFAVSQTPDPTGAYYRYQFLVSTRGINDYPKIGVWPDGYYYTANEYSTGGQFRGAVAVVFEREKMLAGQSAQGVKFGPLSCGSECYFSLQPSHLEGPPPPAGTPNTFVMAYDVQTWGGSGSDGYRLWNFSTNWTTNSFTFTPLPQVNTNAFDAELCGYSRSCVPQPSPGEGLDVLGQFTMYRAQYRQFGSEGRMLLNHTVDLGGNIAGIRWTELRNPGSSWTLHQTGTYGPSDGLHRWMGSIAMDQSGNIALGYSVSGANSFPSIAYNSRAAGDPLGQLSGGEVTLIGGGGVQTSSYNRWGDYASMSVDPSDGCTFWFTTEYYANTGSFDFKTRIGSFKLPSCGGTTPPNNPPTASFTHSCTNLACSFDGSGSSDDGSIVSYSWNFGDGTPAGSGVNPNHNYSAGGTYSVILTVTDNLGATGTTSQNVSVTAPPSTTMHVGDLDASSIPQGKGGNWSAEVIVTIHDSNHNLVSNATVSGEWSNGVSGSSSCITDATGKCTVSKGGLKKGGASVIFSVSDVTLAPSTYAPNANHDPESDSNGTSITVSAP